jgi:hypothetical protein
MTPEDVFELTGQHVHPEIFSVHPTGNLLHVLLELPPKEYGLIKLPESEVGKEKMGVGYIIAAGPRAGHTDYAIPGPSPVGVIVPMSDKLLGLHVIFGSHTGMPLRVDMMDREFMSSVLVMSAKDIRGVDVNIKPLTTRVEERTKR